MIDIREFRAEAHDISSPVGRRIGRLARLMEPLAEALAAHAMPDESPFDLAWALLHDPNRVASVAGVGPVETMVVANELRTRLHMEPLENAMKDSRLPEVALPLLQAVWTESFPERLAAILANRPAPATA